MGAASSVPPEVFVFGSNLAGRHGKGAALYAKRHLGAVYGVGEGLSGQSYALPTKDTYLGVLPFALVARNIRVFLKFAKQHPRTTFSLTPVGTGLAGYPIVTVFETVMAAGLPRNVLLTPSWWDENGLTSDDLLL